MNACFVMTRTVLPDRMRLADSTPRGRRARCFDATNRSGSEPSSHPRNGGEDDHCEGGSHRQSGADAGSLAGSAKDEQYHAGDLVITDCEGSWWTDSFT